ncbi:MAG: dimethylsulfoniopropionate demethylase [Alphaproteobacteria bacterium]|nr:dimethylsulfoniopropionate demethylase [Alphaproteobacteria bacterium]
MGISARIRKSPFFDATRRWGYRSYTTYNHMLMPLVYESSQADYEHLNSAVTLWDTAGERQVEITGPDAARFTQYLVARDLSKCKVGQCKYVILTTPQGGIVNDPVLLKLAENHYWLSLADSDVLLWALGIAHHIGMEVELAEPDVSPLQVQGPKSRDLMHDVFGGWIDELKFFWFREADLDGIPLVISRTGWSGEPGYELFLRDGSRGDELWERMMEAGKPYGIAPAAPNAISRIEGGMLSYGADMTIFENPLEVGLDRFVDLDQEADFIGKSALRRIRETGVSRRMVGLHIAGEAMPANQHVWPVTVDGSWIGRVSSSIFSPGLERNIALALLDIAYTEPGTRVEVDTDAGLRTAEVTTLPFVDHAAAKRKTGTP